MPDVLDYTQYRDPLSPHANMRRCAECHRGYRRANVGGEISPSYGDAMYVLESKCSTERRATMIHKKSSGPILYIIFNSSPLSGTSRRASHPRKRYETRWTPLWQHVPIAGRLYFSDDSISAGKGGLHRRSTGTLQLPRSFVVLLFCFVPILKEFPRIWGYRISRMPTAHLTRFMSGILSRVKVFNPPFAHQFLPSYAYTRRALSAWYLQREPHSMKTKKE